MLTQHTTHLYELMRFNQPYDFIHVATNHQIIDSNLPHSACFDGGKEKEGWGREG
jgi:hypothetical protein